jgi:hypothetical protein
LFRDHLSQQGAADWPQRDKNKYTIKYIKMHTLISMMGLWVGEAHAAREIGAGYTFACGSGSSKLTNLALLWKASFVSDVLEQVRRAFRIAFFVTGTSC